MIINYWQPFEEGCIYHVYNRSNNKETIFLSDENYRFFLRQWDKYLCPYLETFSYALIPNHFHFTARVRSHYQIITYAKVEESTVAAQRFVKGQIPLNEFLEDQMKRFFSSYAKAFNVRNHRKGSVFQKRFKRVTVRNEEDVAYLIAYHHHNPIHHKLSNDYSSWRYTSYQALLNNAPTKLCRNIALGFFGSADLSAARAAFVAYHQHFKLSKEREHLMLE